MRKRSGLAREHPLAFKKTHGALLLILACIIISLVLAKTEHPKRRHFVSPLAVEKPKAQLPSH